MADAIKKPASERLYGKPMRIAKAPDKGAAKKGPTKDEGKSGTEAKG